MNHVTGDGYKYTMIWLQVFVSIEAATSNQDFGSFSATPGFIYSHTHTSTLIGAKDSKSFPWLSSQFEFFNHQEKPHEKRERFIFFHSGHVTGHIFPSFKCRKISFIKSSPVAVAGVTGWSGLTHRNLWGLMLLERWMDDFDIFW